MMKCLNQSPRLVLLAPDRYLTVMSWFSLLISKHNQLDIRGMFLSDRLEFQEFLLDFIQTTRSNMSILNWSYAR